MDTLFGSCNIAPKIMLIMFTHTLGGFHFPQKLASDYKNHKSELINKIRKAMGRTIV